jgi:hypothetical protein
MGLAFEIVAPGRERLSKCIARESGLSRAWLKQVKSVLSADSPLPASLATTPNPMPHAVFTLNPESISAQP